MANQHPPPLPASHSTFPKAIKTLSQGNDVLPTVAGGGHKPSQGPTQTASLHAKHAPQKRPPHSIKAASSS